MKNILFIILCFAFANSIAQSKVNIYESKLSQKFYENLDSLINQYQIEDLRKSKTQAIRIWKSNEIILLKENKAIYTFHAKNSNNEIIKHKELVSQSDLNIKFELIEKFTDPFSDNNYAIDAFPILIELNNAKRYKVISFFRNVNLKEIIESIRDENSIAIVKKEIIQSLPSGNYRIGMSLVKLDYFPEKNKSDFYQKLEPEIKSKLNIDDRSEPTKMPLVLINNKINYFKDLNTLKVSDVKNYEIISDEAKILYGRSAKYGIIKVTTN